RAMIRTKRMTIPPDKTVLAVMASGKRAAEKLDKKSASRVVLPMTCCATRAQAAIVAATTGDAITYAPSPSRAPLVGIARLYRANPQVNLKTRGPWIWSGGRMSDHAARGARCAVGAVCVFGATFVRCRV